MAAGKIRLENESEQFRLSWGIRWRRGWGLDFPHESIPAEGSKEGETFFIEIGGLGGSGGGSDHFGDPVIFAGRRWFQDEEQVTPDRSRAPPDFPSVCVPDGDSGNLVLGLAEEVSRFVDPPVEFFASSGTAPDPLNGGAVGEGQAKRFPGTVFPAVERPEKMGHARMESVRKQGNGQTGTVGLDLQVASGRAGNTGFSREGCGPKQFRLPSNVRDQSVPWG